MSSTTPPPRQDGPDPQGVEALGEGAFREGQDPQPLGDDVGSEAGGRVAPAWSQQSQDSYEQGDSGGWGAPGSHDTGPLRLGLGARSGGASGRAEAGEPDAAHEAGRAQRPGDDDAATTVFPAAGESAAPEHWYGGDHGPGGHYGPVPPQGYPQSGPLPVAPPQSQVRGRPGGYSGGHGPRGGHERGAASAGGGRGRAPRGRAGLSAMLDFTFARKATHAIAPILFWLVVAWGVLQVLYVPVTLAGVGSGGGAILLGVITAIFDALLKIALARVFLELAVNVADLAERSGVDPS